jgi:hypothetical protein
MYRRHFFVRILQFRTRSIGQRDEVSDRDSSVQKASLEPLHEQKRTLCDSAVFRRAPPFALQSDQRAERRCFADGGRLNWRWYRPCLIELEAA